MRSASVLAGALLVFGITMAPGQRHGGGGEAHPDLVTNRASLKKWKEMRFGVFIHWGPVTLRGTEIGWSRGEEVRIGDYDSLYREFNPVLFNAAEWVSTVKAAGMKYLVITAKHHDGFCLWDSKYTAYDIMSTPFHRDVLRELADECGRQGIMFCTYYSILDWHHPHYTTRHGGDIRPVKNSDMNLYRAYLKNQVEELITAYHTNLLWFDGQWEDSWTHKDGMDLYAWTRSLNDGILINNRVDKGHQSGLNGMSASEAFAGDFGTPEQEIGTFENERPWESCITICRQWSWKPNDRLKSLKECLRILAKTAGGGGNLLLNISPMPDGRIEQRQISRLKEIGLWLNRYGESVYGTSGGPLKPASWLTSTCRDNRIYVHLLALPGEELRLPAIPGRGVTGVRMLGGAPLHSRTEGGQLVISLPREPVDDNDAVIELDLDGPAEGIPLLDLPSNGVTEIWSGDVSLTAPPAEKYPGNGVLSLVDNIRGTTDFQDGNWLGFEQADCEAVIDLHSARRLSSVAVGCLQSQGSWIFFPKTVEVAVSENGRDFAPAGRIDTGEPERDEEVLSRDFVIPLKSVTARFVKVRAVNAGMCPVWHAGAGGKAWVFVDEITIK